MLFIRYAIVYLYLRLLNKHKQTLNTPYFNTIMKHTTTLFFILFTSTLMFGQIVDRTEDRAKQKANQRVDNKVDQGIDKGLDAIEGLFKKKDKKEKQVEEPMAKSDSEQNSNMLSRMFGGDVELKDSYSFDHNVQLVIQTFDKKGKENQEMESRMYFSDSEPNFGMDVNASGAESFIIYDMETYQMVTLIDNDGQKMGMAIQLDSKDFEDDDDATADNTKYSFVKTGKSKVITGYNCEEYKMESSDSNDEYDQTYWMTTDIDANWMSSFANAMSSNKNMAKKVEVPKDYPKGSMIQVISESRKNKEKTITTVKEYKKNDRVTISTKGYQLMNVGGGK